MSRLMRKPTVCIYETKGVDQLRNDCEADQRLCFCYTDSMRGSRKFSRGGREGPNFQKGSDGKFQHGKN